MTEGNNPAINDALMADHVPYEIWMLRATHETVGTLPPGLYRNAFIESFAVHARSLINFLNGKDGASAQDFTEGYSSFANGAVPRRLVKKLNQQIPHITEKRFDDPKDKLNLDDIVKLRRTIDAEITQFLRHLQPRYLALWDTAKGQLHLWDDTGKRR